MAGARSYILLASLVFLSCRLGSKGEPHAAADASANAPGLGSSAPTMSVGAPDADLLAVNSEASSSGASSCTEHGALAWVQVLRSRVKPLGHSAAVPDSRGGVVIAINSTKPDQSSDSAYVLRLDDQGREAWQNRWEGPAFFHRMSANRLGTIAALGRFYGSPCGSTSPSERVDASNLEELRSTYLIIADKDQRCSAALQLEGARWGTGVRIADSGEVFAVGDFQESIRVGDVKYAAVGDGADGFVVKTSASGALLRSRHLYEKGGSYLPLDVALDPRGGVLVWGLKYIRRGQRPGSDPRTEDFVTKLDNQLETVWTTPLGSPLGVTVYMGTGIDSAGALLHAGTCCRGATFIEKRATDGRMLWRSMTEQDPPFNHYAKGISIDANDNVFVTGVFHGYLQFGKRRLSDDWARAQVGARNSYGFVVKLSPAGELMWSRTMGDAIPQGTVVSGDSVYVVGELDGNALALEPATYMTGSSVRPGGLFVARYCI